ncbi:hypothetical protein EV215_0952 [Hypnocyclicus thermotrophus]|uniref:Uncharacterized protein n=1 Tax=Hypnocyclicus thermotrophus TaxID=1627895 RepID=A0AA46DZ84_9FUSO|nr:hypothetical protein [Hypnocyclicus thermotrophus]TDT71574.1 hypothetical protein EV215_0952 [Hypnocyclicus thermotrophus]
MNKGGAREGSGRKPLKDKLKIFNFRLSIDDIKIIDKLGVGKNSSDKLRYILKKYKSDKINIKTRRAAYKIEKSNNFNLLNKNFNTFIEEWKNINKIKFLLNSNLKNIIKKKRILKMKVFIENNEHFNLLQTLNWNINLIDFDFKKIEIYKIFFQKNDITLEMFFSEKEEDLKHNLNSLSEKEEELFSFLFEDLEQFIATFKLEIESEILFDKTYSNGDIYKYLEYENITIIELEYIKELDIAILTTLKPIENV